MPSYDSTARVPFASGGKVGSKKPKIKRIILWKGKAKDWPGAKKAAERTKKAKGGIASESARKKNKEAQAKSIGKAKKVLKNVSYLYPQTWGYHAGELGKKIKGKFRDKKAEGGSIGKLRQTERKKSSKQSRNLQREKRQLQKEMGADTSYKKGGRAKDSVDQPGTHSWWLLNKNKRDKKAKGGKADKNWIQGVNKSIKKRGTKGVCTGKKFGSASCKPGSKRYNLAKTFKKMARAKHASGGLVRFI